MVCTQSLPFFSTEAGGEEGMFSKELSCSKSTLTLNFVKGM